MLTGDLLRLIKPTGNHSDHYVAGQDNESARDIGLAARKVIIEALKDSDYLPCSLIAARVGMSEKRVANALAKMAKGNSLVRRKKSYNGKSVFHYRLNDNEEL